MQTPDPEPRVTTTPTPKAPPRLSGGFGRPRVSPAPESSAPLDPDRGAEAAQGKRPEKSPVSPVSITNKTLITDPQKGRVSTVQASNPKATPAAGSPVTPPRTTAAEPLPAGESAGDPSRPNEEARWRLTARNARVRVEALRKGVEDLQKEEAKLQNDFYAWDDGQYRDGVIKPAWDRKREELEAARKELTEAEKELSDLPEKARKAGALPGWLRE